VSDPFVGEVRLFSFDFPPRGWATASGQLLPIQQNQALFSLLGTTYGGNGVTTFALPDLRGRAPVHRATNGTYVQGQAAGTESVGLNQTTMPAHTHLLLATTTTADKKLPTTAMAACSNSSVFYYSAANNLLQINPASIGTVGGNQPHQNMQPYLVVNYSIAMQGIFPSRN